MQEQMRLRALKGAILLWEANGCIGRRAPIRCCGLAEYFDIDPTLVRVGWVIAFFCGTFGFWAYLICTLIMPKKSDIYPGY